MSTLVEGSTFSSDISILSPIEMIHGTTQVLDLHGNVKGDSLFAVPSTSLLETDVWANASLSPQESARDLNPEQFFEYPHDRSKNVSGQVRKEATATVRELNGLIYFWRMEAQMQRC